MEILLIALVVAFFSLLIIGRDREEFTWLSFIALCGAAGTLSAVINDNLIFNENDRIYLIKRICSFISYYGLPYCYLNFCIKYNGIGNKLVRRRIALLLTSPIFYMILFSPYQIEPVQFNILVLWTIPYFLIGTIFFFYSNITVERVQTHRILIISVIIPTLIAGFNENIPPLFGISEAWRYNLFPVIAGVIIVFIAIFYTGLFDVRIYLKKLQGDITLQTISSGTVLINHAIKNELGKIDLYATQLEISAKQAGSIGEKEDAQLIQSSCQYLLDLIKKIQSQTSEYELNLEATYIGELIENQIQTLQRNKEQIKLELTLLEQEFPILVDKLHFCECLKNILYNAIDAMPNGGTITITQMVKRKHTHLIIRDTGIGMNALEVVQATDPFFTTKGNSSTNFGLGLSYVQKVIKKHGGKLKILSIKGKGTEISIILRNGDINVRN